MSARQPGQFRLRSFSRREDDPDEIPHRPAPNSFTSAATLAQLRQSSTSNRAALVFADLFVYLEERRGRRFLKKHPTEKPFFGAGLDFRPLDEPCEANGKHYRRSQTITRTEAGRNRAYVDVEFAYPKACREEPIVYRVHLRKLRGKWLIDDWTYSSGMTLTREMKENKYGLSRH